MIGAAASAIPVAGKAGRGEDADVAGAGAAEPAAVRSYARVAQPGRVLT